MEMETIIKQYLSLTTKQFSSRQKKTGRDFRGASDESARAYKKTYTVNNISRYPQHTHLVIS